MWATFNDIFLFSFGLCSYKENWSPVSKQNAPEEEETADIFHEITDMRIREEISQTEIPGILREGESSQGPENDRRTSQNLVSK